MKRSRQVALTVMATTSLTLTACGNNSGPTEKAKLYRSVEACSADKNYTEAQCQEAFDEAKKEHEQGAPRYDSRSLCEQEFGSGACEQRRHTSGTGSFWLPFFAGWAMSNVFDNVVGNRGYYSTPIYRPRYQSDWYTSSGTVIRPSSGGSYRVARTDLKEAPKVSKVRNRTSVISRGGFASRSSRSGGGSSRGG